MPTMIRMRTVLQNSKTFTLQMYPIVQCQTTLSTGDVSLTHRYTGIQFYKEKSKG